MMQVAVDTNVLARLATGDSAAEHAAAVDLLARHAVHVPVSVILELEWVLRSRYGYSADQFLAFSHWLLQQPGVELAEGEAVRAAFELHQSGFDFADALHLELVGGKPLATFDRDLQRRAHGKRLAVHALIPG